MRLQVCEHIVLPNLGITDDLIELFEMNWVEYIRRDTEGSDHDTRRRAATDLVRSLTEKFPAEVPPWDVCGTRSSSCTFAGLPSLQTLHGMPVAHCHAEAAACPMPKSLRTHTPHSNRLWLCPRGEASDPAVCPTRDP